MQVIDFVTQKWQYRSISFCMMVNPFSVFSNKCVNLNADVAFSPNVISNVTYMYDWLSNIDELVKANVNLIKETH